MLSTKRATILSMFYWTSVVAAFAFGAQLPQFASELRSLHAEIEERSADYHDLEQRVAELKRLRFSRND